MKLWPGKVPMLGTAACGSLFTQTAADDLRVRVSVKPLETGQQKLTYVRRPFQAEPEFAVESINYKLSELLSRRQAPS